MSGALFIHNAAIGDFLISLRLLKLWELDVFQWTYLGKPALGRLARSMGAIGEYVNIETGSWHMLFGQYDAIPAELREFIAGFSLVVNMLAGADNRVSQNLNRLASGRVYHIEPKLPDDFSYSQGHYWQYLVRQIDTADDSSLPTWSYRPDQASLDAAGERFAETGVDPSRLVLIHPGASAPAKRWPIDNFMALAEAIRSSALVPGFLIGPVEREQFSTAAIDQLGELGPVWADLRIAELAAMLALVRAYVGNDSGISHLAGAVGAPTLVIFTSTNPTIWRPLGPNVRVTARTGRDEHIAFVLRSLERLGPQHYEDAEHGADDRHDTPG